MAFRKYCSRQVLLLAKQSVRKPLRYLSNVYLDMSSTAADPLDSFTSKLVQEKREKWKNLSTRKITASEKDLGSCEKRQNDNGYFQSNDVDILAMNELLRKSIDAKECNIVLSLLSISEKKRLSPSLTLLLEAASIFSRTGNKTGVDAVKAVCKISDEDEYISQAKFKHYVAEATWVNGNVEEALEIFTDVYKHHPALRRKVRYMTKYLVAECVSNKSEAAVVLVTNFAKKYAVEYKDFYFLASLWQSLFLSEWFADNKLANELLEEYSGLRAVLADKVQFLAGIALAQGDSEVVQRLCEITLHYDMKKQYTYILRSFFDYKCSKADLKGCTEILASAVDGNVSLTRKQHDKFLTLLINSHQNSWFFERKRTQHQQKQLTVPSFQLKF